MRIWKTRCHVQSKSVIIVHILISNLDELISTFNDDLLLENWIKHRINFILDGFDKNWEALLQWPFESISQIWMIESHDAILLLKDWLSSLDPVDGLSLWIDHEWVSGRSSDHDTVLNGELIWWKTF